MARWYFVKSANCYNRAEFIEKMQIPCHKDIKLKKEIEKLKYDEKEGYIKVEIDKVKEKIKKLNEKGEKLEPVKATFWPAFKKKKEIN